VLIVGGCYDTAKRNLILNEIFGQFCSQNKIEFSNNHSVLSPDETTLFCTSGMHHFKKQFLDKNYQHTSANIQRCLRLNDLDEIGDGTHYLVFHMLGLFSFREWSLQKTVDFWMSFLESINLIPDHVTIHPDQLMSWKSLYQNYHVDIHVDQECKWSDGNIGGYCTEFYRKGVEIGNIVNTMGDCIDVGFGGERLLEQLGLLKPMTPELILSETIEQLFLEGVEPGHYKHGFILKKLMNKLLFEGGKYEHPYFDKLYEQQRTKWFFYLKKKDHKRFIDFDSDWWMNTHGIDTKNHLRYLKIFGNND